MLKIVGIGGPPASGKTRVARFFLERNFYRNSCEFFQFETVKYLYNRFSKTYVLGVYSEKGKTVWEGTDKLSMSAQPAALGMLQAISRQDFPARVFFEGDRFFNESFLRATAKLGDSRFYVLSAPPAILERRRRARGLEERPFDRAVKTKTDNLVEKRLAMPYLHTQDSHTRKLLREIEGFLYSK